MGARARRIVSGDPRRDHHAVQLASAATRRGPAMIESIGRRLRLVLARERSGDLVQEHVPVPSLPPEVEFIGYAEDCLLMGHIRMNTTRLTDLLNDHDEYQLIDVFVEGLVEDRAIQVPEVVVAREDLLMVHAIGPRGDRDRRVRTRQHPMAMQIGPYHVRGYLHALPGSDPVASFRHRRTMVPLTDAWVEYDQGSIRQRRRVATLVVNRGQVDWIAAVLDDEVELPDLPIQVDKGPLTKDFTGHVLGRR